MSRSPLSSGPEFKSGFRSNGTSHSRPGMVKWSGDSVQGRGRNRRNEPRPVLLSRSALAAAGVPRGLQRERAMDALASGGLEALARVPARVLSRGEPQRLALVRAMATRPDALFLDEATANLDPNSTLAIENLVRSARELGTPVLLVTRDLAQARRVAERILYLNDGILEADSRAPDFFTAPPTRRARAFVEGRLTD